MMDLNRPLLLPAEPEAPTEEVALPPDATSLHFLQAIYRSPQQPMARRMRAAVAAIGYEHPKLAVAVSITTGFGSALEARMERTGRRAVIDAPRTLAKPAEE